MTGTNQRPLRKDAQLNRDRIISAAREVFAQRGITGTLHDVADHAGVGIGTVYRRFATKEELVDAVFEQRLAEMAADIEAGLRAPAAWDGLTAVLRNAAGLHAADRGLRDVALGDWFGHHHQKQLGDRLEPPLRALVDRAHAEGSLRPDVTAEDLPVLLMMISELAHHSDPVRPGTHLRYLQMILDGIRNPPAAGDLGEPLDRDQLDAIGRRWLPGAVTRS